MISFDSFIAQDGVPIYLQIVKHIKSGIVSGTVVNGDEVPSRRVLSALLGVNPNTIQKAYKIVNNIVGFFRTARYGNAGVRPERLYGFYPEMGGTFLSPVFSAHLGENKSDKLRGLGQSPNHAVRISSKRSSKNIINCPIILPQSLTGLFHFLLISFTDKYIDFLSESSVGKFVFVFVNLRSIR